MFYLNKIVGALTMPIPLLLTGIILSLLFSCLGHKRFARGLLAVSIAWIWFWSMPLTNRWVGATLERAFLVEGRVPAIESYPQVDAIQLHGGSIGSCDELAPCVTNSPSSRAPYTEMWTSADRVWLTARLWHEQMRKMKENGDTRSVKIFVTGTRTAACSVGLLMDFGIPTNALVVAEAPRNTEEEAKFIAAEMNQMKKYSVGKPKVLVVTSAWHMKRTMLMYAKYAQNIEAIPAPCDFENSMRRSGTVSIQDFIPNDEALLANRIALHEWVGIFGYQYFR